MLSPEDMEPSILQAKQFNVIGDIHGQFKTLKALLKKMPTGAIPISAGDMVDRGPRSREVLEFFMERGYAVLGNHEHLMLDWLREGGIYNQPPDHWLINCGGAGTMGSFCSKAQRKRKDFFLSHEELRSLIPKDVLEWLLGLPRYLLLDQESQGLGRLFISHAPLNPVIGLKKALEAVEYPISHTHFSNSITWNRGTPRPIPGITLQVYGHIARKEKLWHMESKTGKRKIFAVGIDSSKGEKLTGIHWPSMKLFEQKWID